MPSTHFVLKDSPGEKVFMLGAEAIARGALEAGVGMVTTYPGTPASEVGDTISDVAKDLPGLHFQYSTNEAVALENAIGGAWAGVRSLCAMKHVGMNVAADPFFTLCYIGVQPGSLVLLVGEDPGCLSSTNEQDNRYYALHAHTVCLEPSNSQECKDFTLKAYELSEKFDLPIILNSTHRTLHGIGEVTLGKLTPPKAEGQFKKAPGKYVSATLVAVGNKGRLLSRIQKAEKAAGEMTDLNRIIPGQAKTGVIAAGSSFNYTMEALDALGIHDYPILKLGMVYPINPDLIEKFAQGLEKVMVVEELEGFVEAEIKRILFEKKMLREVHGKDLFPAVGELNTDLVIRGMSRTSGVKEPVDYAAIQTKYSKALGKALLRNPGLCPGCPHRATAYALKRAAQEFVQARGKGQVVFGGDIGCYATLALPPYTLQDWLLCMGAGFNIAAGMSFKVKDTMVGMIGDSTFLHAGIPGLISAVYNNANVLIVIMDNKWVAMTGGQPTPASGISSLREEVSPAVNLRDIVKACGVKHVRAFDPYNIRHAIEVITEALEEKGVRVLISERECALPAKRRTDPIRAAEREKGKYSYYAIEPDRCQNCEECYRRFACPALIRKEEDGKEFAYIEDARCNLCGACKEVCRSGMAITKTTVNPHL
ncbi:MAG: indolepyruvate ferredoxin oxidoreductase subunit alpha [Promethearchaeati archaeon SRVP18_Atabeyarchaeia-1]